MTEVNRKIKKKTLLPPPLVHHHPFRSPPQATTQIKIQQTTLTSTTPPSSCSSVAANPSPSPIHHLQEYQVEEGPEPNRPPFLFSLVLLSSHHQQQHHLLVVVVLGCTNKTHYHHQPTISTSDLSPSDDQQSNSLTTMKCKIHPFEPPIGVCASCLRDRLLTLTAHQSSSSFSIPSLSPPTHHHHPLPFPRSVSPYTSHHRSLAVVDGTSPFCHPQLFYRTPQVGPESRKKRLSILSKLFRSESKSFSWFSSFVSRKKDCHRGKAHRSQSLMCKGLSPEPEDDDDSISPVWRLPAPTPIRRQCRLTNVSGFAVCFSPLVRASMQRESQVGSGELGFSGEIRNGSKLKNCQTFRQGPGGGPARLGTNRSRKLADFGKFQ